ncbi:MAG TPA: site-2 protease family protein [Methanomassiliicoccales archaeon]|jgi:Zn-dependent protease|nr:site-2 protease family protein [Methanomassiliicoccales archaeon]
MYDEYGNLYVPAGYGKIHFGRQELMHIGIAVAVLTFAFAMALGGTVNLSLLVLGVAALAVLTGFLLHELGHKFMAQRYGAWAEFRIFPLGLMMALVFSLLGFVFAAPGAVYIQGRMTPKQNGLISIAGPGVNIIISAIALVASLMFPAGNLAGDILFVVAELNAFMALFNLLPVPPLDGSKVFHWNKVIWVVSIAISAVLLAVTWGFI